MDQQLSEELAFLIGTADGPEQVHASPWGPAYVARTEVTGRVQLGGNLLLVTQQQQRPDGTSFEIVNVFMRDPADEALLLYAFDTLGYTPDPPARGRWQGDELIMDRTTPRGTSRTSFKPTTTGFTWSKQFQRPGDDKWQQVVDAELTSQK